MLVGERLRRLRLERGLSQRDLSSEGVSYAYISRIEAGQRNPSMKALRKLAAMLDVTPEYLETGDDSVRVRLSRPVALAMRAAAEEDGTVETPTLVTELLAGLQAAISEAEYEDYRRQSSLLGSAAT